MADSVTHTIGPELHRRLGIDLFNGTWRLLELPERTSEQDAEMVDMAHASYHHWRQVGTLANHAHAEWQLARVYSELGRAEPALEHARRCLALAEAGGDGFEDWDLAAAHEATARAQLVAGDRDTAQFHAARAAELLEHVADADDRAVVETDLVSLDLL